MACKPSLWQRIVRFFTGKKPPALENSAATETQPDTATKPPAAEKISKISPPRQTRSPSPPRRIPLPEVEQPPPTPRSTLPEAEEAHPSSEPASTKAAPQSPPPTPPPAKTPPPPAEPEPPPRRPLVDLVIGIDFGTSCSKVVIGDPGWRDQYFPVPFGKDTSLLQSWLDPTKYGRESNLKMRLTNTPNDRKVRLLVSCYLTYLIRHAMRWFEEHAPADYHQTEITWSLNLGFPEKSVDQNSPLASAYRDCAALALHLASVAEVPSRALAERVWKGKENPRPIFPPERIHLYPEIAAQLAGYVRSPHRQFGNLLLIDVGAGTLDVSTLIIHALDQADKVSFHVCDVKPLGALRLFKARSDAMLQVNPNCPLRSLESLQDGVSPIPESFDEMVTPRYRRSEILRLTYANSTARFAEECIATALPCLTQFRLLQRTAHQNSAFDPWPNTLRFFLTGGGSRSSFYREIFAGGRLESELSRFTRWRPTPAERRARNQGLALQTMPEPYNLRGFPANLMPDVDRLSVAYGLAQGTDNLMGL